ncbi:MAG: M14 family zinc carboxypeptidase [Candidatus Cloacimonas sp.]|nr:carboxypeptidase regulatory-like domain-containing protein [Candidatus Cloacimonadota bacterium]
MQRILMTIIISMLAVYVFGQAMLPDFYHRYSDIEEKIFEWEQQYPEKVVVKQIGVSQQDQLPIYAVKIGINAQQDADKPAILVIGSVHAEEIVGNEIVMKQMEQILQGQNQSPYNRWLFSLELWFVPTLNPEGLKVVTDGLDLTYRKNKRDNNNNGIFDFIPGKGNDIDGVDLNRNFPFNWVHGDTLYHAPPGVNEPFDYYRGPGPGSESEIQTIMNLLEEKHFVYSIIWHTSRSGNFSEKVYYPFHWSKEIPSPDFELAQSIGEGVASKIMKYNSGQTYENLPSLSRTGNAHDWFYQQHGTIQLMIECATSNIQPQNESVLIEIVDQCINGQQWLFDRALNGQIDRSPMLTGLIKDANTGEPLVAEVIVHEHHASYFAPRLSDKKYGRFWRPLRAGSYTVTIRKEGYEPQTIENVSVNNSGWKRLTVNLVPLSEATLTGTVLLDGNPVNGEIVISGYNEEVIYADEKGLFSYDGYEGEFDLTVISEGAYPYIGTIALQPGVNEVVIDLSTESVIFEENWDTGVCNWDINGPWKLIEENSMEGYAMADSWDGGNNFYAPNADVSITTNYMVNLTSYVEPNYQTPYLSFWQNLYTVWDYDFVRVEASTDSEEWVTLYQKSGKYDYWHQVFVSLEKFAGKEFYLRFRLTADAPDPALVDPGWIIDNIRIVSGKSELSSIESEELTTLPKQVVKLNQNYPNPFNPETTISFSVKTDSYESAEIKIYNIRGALVEKIPLNDNEIRERKVVWNAHTQPSGVYLYNLVIDGKTFDSKKALLLK